MHRALSEALAEMERLYNEAGEAAAEAYASRCSDDVPQWTDDLANFMVALTDEGEDTIPPEVAQKAVRDTRLWLARLHAAERDVRGLKDVAETNRAAYEEALNGQARILLSDEPPSLEQWSAAVRRADPENAHTLAWDEHPEGYTDTCYCAECRDTD